MLAFGSVLVAASLCCSRNSFLLWLASPSVMAAFSLFSFPWMWEMLGILARSTGEPGLTPPGTRTKNWILGLPPWTNRESFLVSGSAPGVLPGGWWGPTGKGR